MGDCIHEEMNPLPRKRKRDEYGTYSPEIRLKMAKHCIKHGPAKTAKQFSEELGRPISESTVRSMKKTFLSNPKRELLKTAMPTLPRGRPIKLSDDQSVSLRRGNGGDHLNMNKKCEQSLMEQMGFSNCNETKTMNNESTDCASINSSFIQQVLDTEAERTAPNSLVVNCDQTGSDEIPYGIVKVEVSEEDYDWVPPCEAEMKIIQARRERSDKISKLMGDYLLKGYKMLGSMCQECSTILLQDKQGANYCIACNELDTDTDKDDPVLSREAARSQMLEASAADHDDTEALSYMMRPPAPQASVSSSRPPAPQASVSSSRPSEAQAVSADATSTVSASVPKHQTVSSASGSAEFSPAVEVLRGKIRWATDELKHTSSVDYSITLCQMIKNAADAIQSLKNAS